MFNIGTGELMVILLVALLVLGPTKLPGAARQTAKTLTELRKVSTGFQREMKAAMDDAYEVEARDRGHKAVSGDREGTAAAPTTPNPDASSPADTGSGSDASSPADTGSGTGDPAVSTAAAAGMYATSGEPDDAASDDADHSS
jgi:sec-independent protein translocase protein TatB